MDAGHTGGSGRSGWAWRPLTPRRCVPLCYSRLCGCRSRLQAPPHPAKPPRKSAALLETRGSAAPPAGLRRRFEARSIRIGAPAPAPASLPRWTLAGASLICLPAVACSREYRQSTSLERETRTVGGSF